MGYQQNPDRIPRAIGDTRRYLDQKPTQSEPLPIFIPLGDEDGD